MTVLAVSKDSPVQLKCVLINLITSLFSNKVNRDLLDLVDRLGN